MPTTEESFAIRTVWALQVKQMKGMLEDLEKALAEGDPASVSAMSDLYEEYTTECLPEWVNMCSALCMYEVGEPTEASVEKFWADRNRVYNETAQRWNAWTLDQIANNPLLMQPILQQVREAAIGDPEAFFG